MFKNQYHYIVAGLPDILLDDTRLVQSTSDLMAEISESLSNEDFALLKLILMKLDNKNILTKLQNADAKMLEYGNFDDDLLTLIISSVKDESFGVGETSAVPEYFKTIITTALQDNSNTEGKSLQTQLTSLYYDYSISVRNEFVSKWFCFERDLTNFISAYNCRKYNIKPIENQLVGESEFTLKFTKSTSRDFGITDDLPNISQLIKALDEESILDQEKQLDLYRWDFIEEIGFFHYFSIERIFIHILKLSMIERWLKLDKERGIELFKKYINEMEASYEFPKEFSVNR